MPDVVAALSAPSDYSAVFGTGIWDYQWLDPDLFRLAHECRLLALRALGGFAIAAGLAVLSHKNANGGRTAGKLLLFRSPETDDFCGNQGLARCKSWEEQRKTSKRLGLKLRSAASEVNGRAEPGHGRSGQTDRNLQERGGRI